MADILDYLKWRGDLSIKNDPVNEIDAIILCQLSYIDFTGFVSESFSKYNTIEEVAEKFKNAPDFEDKKNVGALLNPKIIQLLFDAGASKRFAQVKMCGFISKLDMLKEEQFAAVTFQTDDNHFFIAFRGTDDTLIGWKEDFNLGVLETVPAQQDAVKYLNFAAHKLWGKIRIGGHSKGGNLSVFAAANCLRKYKRRISEIYNFDGPGFNEEKLKKENYISLVPFLYSFYPQFSIVGMLFSHFDSYQVIESDESGIMQHDPFSWHVMGTDFVTLKGFESGSVFWDTTLNTWFVSLTNEQRGQFVETVFDILKATDATTNTEIGSNWFASTSKMLKALASLDSDTRRGVLKMIQLLFKIGQKNLPQTLRSL